MSKGKIIQSAKLYLQKEGEKEMRHITNWSTFLKVCQDLELSTDWKDRAFLDDEDFPPKGKPITEWPEGEEPPPEQRNISILWMGDEKWLNDFGGTHIVGFHEPCRPGWYPPSKVKLISYLKGDSHDNDRIRARVEEAKDHPNHGGYWLISGHEPDITGNEPSVAAHMKRRIEQYNIIRTIDSDAWNHPVVTFYDCTGKFDRYPGYEDAFIAEDHDVWIADIYANNPDGTVDYPGLERAARLIEIGLSRSWGQFIPNLGACYDEGEKPASLVDQWEWWNKRFGPLNAICFWNSGSGSWATGIYEDEFLGEEAREINRRLGLLK